MKKKSILIIGAGGHAKSCIDLIEQLGNYQISGIVGLPSEIGRNVLNYKVIDSDQNLAFHVQNCENALIAIGQISTASLRIQLFEKAIDAGYNLPTLISPSATVSPHSKIGRGTIVMRGAVVNAGSVIGDNCIINSQAIVEHDVEISSHCHISTGAILNGKVSIGTGSFLGSGAIIKEGVRIGPNSLVGMGLAVRKDLSSGSKFYGEELK